MWSCLKRGFFRLLRAPRSRGFGVQSPFAYRFIREVVRGTVSEENGLRLRRLYPQGEKKWFRQAALYERLSRYQGPCQWGICPFQGEIYEDAVLMGCPKATVVDCIHGYELELVAQSKVVVMDLEENWWRVYEAFADHAAANSVLVVEDIHYSRETLKAWRKIIADSRSGVSFDLYDCGIVFFDRKKYKRSYRVSL
ncbi:hypothetical protein [Prevotella sp. KH2C16]|uniref:hypothetical protein n=1 Tax=Prevotella sp. KH2C16 TaxID=1855325 RepID=UPI0008F29C56|nr:hypothetical protein [Prevotella sp. KH2C16]SFG57985.1 hypothetical protein SAMN05216383_1212 [Prevotella sp. KH2C16]